MIIDGKKIAKQIQEELKDEIAHMQGSKPCLAVILVGENPASQIYVRRKAEACESIHMTSIRRHFPSDISEKKLLEELIQLNNNPEVNGILVQLPLPAHINSSVITQAISPQKDVDGLHPLNVGKLLIGDSDGFVPCTPLGIQALLLRSGVEIAGKHVVVMGRSNLVGKPIAALLMQNNSGANATVTLLHSYSKNIKELCRSADILIVAMGKPKIITADMIKEGAVVIDVGINKIAHPQSAQGFQIVGDVDFEMVQEKCSLITPVPGGVGPMTIAMLLSNTLKSYKKSMSI